MFQYFVVVLFFGCSVFGRFDESVESRRSFPLEGTFYF